MPEVLRILGAALAAYIVGSIPWAVIVVRVFWKQDIRTLGSGNTGATNVLRVFGTAPGVAVLVLDAAKGALGVWLASLLVPAGWGADGLDLFRVIGAAAAIAGHSFSPFIGFRGGKGVATAAGAIAMLAPRVMPVMLVIFVLVVAIWKYVSLGSIVIAALFPGVSWLMYPDRHALVAFAVLVAALVIWRHRSNIGRIRRGEESRITFRRRTWDELKHRRDDRSGEQ
jgi:glycerol-3-phosphate acyltransferase PlsY